jgi:lysophospholipase L1-like esterase
MALRVSQSSGIASLHRLTITTLNDAPVIIAGVSLFNTQNGLSVSKVGYPGATVDILSKLDDGILKDQLYRLNPQLIILAFGTNEGFNDSLDIEAYHNRYRQVVNRLRSTLPEAQIVIVAPPSASRGGPCSSPPNLDRVRAKLNEIAADSKLDLWDWSSIMPAWCAAQSWALANPKLMAPDHVHLTRAGYELSATHFLQFLEPILLKIRNSGYALSKY